jgi:hypothetical protein
MLNSADEKFAARTCTGLASSFIRLSTAGGSRFLEMMRKHPQLSFPLNKATYFFTDHYSQKIAGNEPFFSQAGPERVQGAKNQILTVLEVRAPAPGKVSRRLYEFKSARFGALGIVAMLAPATALAYLDPNAPGLLYQILFPLVVAVTLAWRRIKDTVSWLWLRIRRKED